VAGEISGAFFALRLRIDPTPRKPSPAQIRDRIGGAFSRMPAAKTNVSNPPSVAAKEPIHFLAW